MFCFPWLVLIYLWRHHRYSPYNDWDSDSAVPPVNHYLDLGPSSTTVNKSYHPTTHPPLKRGTPCRPLQTFVKPNGTDSPRTTVEHASPVLTTICLRMLLVDRPSSTVITLPNLWNMISFITLLSPDDSHTWKIYWDPLNSVSLSTPYSIAWREGGRTGIGSLRVTRWDWTSISRSLRWLSLILRVGVSVSHPIYSHHLNLSVSFL